MSSIVVFLLLLAAEPSAPRTTVPAYSNADLDRLAPRREEGGVFVTTPTPSAAPDKAAPTRDEPERGEEYWRREAEKVRDRVRPLLERAELLREQIEERQRKPGVRPYSDPRVRALQRDLARVVEQARELEDRLEDRARRARALPGWLR